MLGSIRTMFIGSLYAVVFFSAFDFNQVSARIPDTRGDRDVRSDRDDGYQNRNYDHRWYDGYRWQGGYNGPGYWADYSTGYATPNYSNYPSDGYYGGGYYAPNSQQPYGQAGTYSQQYVHSQPRQLNQNFPGNQPTAPNANSPAGTVQQK